MQTERVYKQFYEFDSTAKKIERKEEYKRVEKNKTQNVSVKKHKNVLIPFILGVFAMTLIITSRYTLINEKNVESIRLKTELEKAESTLFSAKIAVEQKTDLNKIEAYAKQQLGMQKPSKNQIIYVDTSENIGTVEIIENEGFFSGVKSGILNFINGIF